MQSEAMKYLALLVRLWIDRHFTSWSVGVEEQQNGLSEIPTLFHAIYFRGFGRNRKPTNDNLQHKTNRNNNILAQFFLTLRKSVEPASSGLQTPAFWGLG
jgi:hypothetical protein